ncbi:HAD-IIIC family phosphatase [Acidithiobacillus montserratensis]|uniref:HAD-IIIC family phosphatase n=1 Tax=Acidithiobacillus montserratensis TaxID=2729135 RepID=A0ACD5HGR2_9PROT|nr:HAD-IIIC family phosphatase [Acidithiobacillaceae bacterium]MBU2749239.1 HAD-IIIC family phosphatase [Acidithiobacillus montserratensis]
MSSSRKADWWQRWRGQWRSPELAELSHLEDAAFLEAVYQKLLGRPTDPAGREHYLPRVQSPGGRKLVIRALKNSEEARLYQDRQARIGLLMRTEMQEQEHHSPVSSLVRFADNSKPRIALLGTCLLEGLLQTALALDWPVQHYLMNSGQHDPVPELAALDFDLVLVQFTLRTLLSQVVATGDGDLFHLRSDVDWATLQDQARQLLLAQVQKIRDALPQALPVLFLSFLEPPAQINGLLGMNRQNSLYALVRGLNDAFEAGLAEKQNAFYLEINDLRLHYGDNQAYDGYFSHFSHGGILNTPQGDLIHLGILEKTRAALQILLGDQPVKLIITDLDNTLWKGVLAEMDEIIPVEVTEGWPLGYAEALLTCKARGILLAICSKNDEEQTKIRFNQVWYGRLRLEDFASMRINWQPKSENIRQILAELNILPEHALFIDDNPLEIAEVQRAFPQLRTLTGDPHQWRMALLYGIPFQVAKLSEESTRRTELLQAKIQRDQAMLSTDRESFLRDLQLRAEIHPLTPSDKGFDRALELLNRTNQFNTTGQRWTTAELQNFLAAEGRLWVLQASDRLARHGLVAVALLKADCLWQMVLSCRVFGLGLETALLARILDEPAPGATLQARWMDTGRNATARQFLEQFFAPQTEDRYALRERLVVPAHITV